MHAGIVSLIFIHEIRKVASQQYCFPSDSKDAKGTVRSINTK